MGSVAPPSTVMINASGGGMTLNSDVRQDGHLVLKRGIIEGNGHESSFFQKNDRQLAFGPPKNHYKVQLLGIRVMNSVRLVCI